MEKNFQYEPRRLVLFILTIFGMICVFFSAFCIFSNYRESSPMDELERINISKDFVNMNGEKVSLKQIKEPTSFVYKINGDELKSRKLCFRSKNIFFNVSVNGVTIYEFAPKIPKLYGRSYGLKFHTIYLGDYKEDVEIMIDCNPVYHDTTAFFDDVYLDYGESYMNYEFKHRMPGFLICFFMIVLGLTMAVTALLVKTTKERRLEIFAIGAFGFSTACWSCTETMILQIITGNSAAIHYMNYISQMVMPISCMIFVPSIAKVLDNLFVRMIGFAAVLNVAVSTFLTLNGIKDYHDTLFVNHIIFVITILTCAILIIKTIIKHDISQRQSITIISAFGFVVLGAALDMFKWYFIKTITDSALFLRFGLLIFMLMMGVYEVYELIRSRRFEREAKLMRNLAFTDSLTQLKNRMAYSEKLDSIQKETKGRCVFVQLDTNDLKKTNDKYGHNEGDLYIKSAARILEESFSGVGTAYRTGGDEFVIILDGLNCLTDCKLGISKMLSKIDEYNASGVGKVELSMAYGYAVYDYSKQNPEEACKEADSKMYIKKREMKGKK